MTNIKNFLWYQFPAILWAAALFIQSSLSYIQTPSLGIDFQDKIFHSMVYLIFGIFIIRAFYYNTNSKLRNNAILNSIIVGILYGISDEVHQYFVPGREATFGDLIADSIGIILAALSFFWVKKIISPKRA